MDAHELRKQEYIALRKEVDGQQWRSFITVIIGLLGMPTLGYFLLGADNQVWLILPLLVLVLIMLYLVQQNEMMRVGRYIRERLETGDDKDPSLPLAIEPVVVVSAATATPVAEQAATSRTVDVIEEYPANDFLVMDGASSNVFYLDQEIHTEEISEISIAAQSCFT